MPVNPPAEECGRLDPFASDPAIRWGPGRVELATDPALLVDNDP